MVNRQSLTAGIRAFHLTPHALRLASPKGFTVVELLVSILLTSIIMGAIYSVFRVQTHSSKVQENRLEAQEYARSTLDMMVREIRNAAYNPLATSLGNNCAGGLPGTPSVVTATATSFRFTYDFQGTTSGSAPNGACDNADEDITYTYTTGCAAGLGDVTRNGTAMTDCNVSAFTLTYYAQDCTIAFVNPVGAGTATCSASNNGTLAAIQRVSISITVKSKNADAEFGGQLTVTMTSNADLRNRGLPS